MAYNPEDLIQQTITRAYRDDYTAVDALTDALRTTQTGINNWINQDLAPEQKKVEKDREKLEVLDGSRQRGASGKAAVRFGDLRALDRFPSIPPNNRHLSSAPTADDFNKLAQDVKKLYEILGTLSVTISRRL